MNSIVIDEVGDSSVLKYKRVTESEIRSNEVRVKVTATTVNYIDVLIRSGRMPPGMMPQLPFTPGVECVGLVEEVGEDVQAFTMGDKIAFFGKIGAATYAEKIITSSKQLIKIPSTIDNVLGAVIPVNYSTAYHMLHNIAKVTKEDTILVHAAAGGVGTAIIQLAKIIGATVIGSVGSDKKKEYILNEGANYAINYKKEDIAEVVLEITKGKGVNVSLNPVAGKSLISDLDLLSSFGHLIVFGFITGLPETKLQEALLNHFNKSLTVSYSDIYTLYNHDFDQLKSIMSRLFTFLNEGEIAPKIFKELPLTQATRAHDLLESGQVVGKLILTP